MPGASHTGRLTVLALLAALLLPAGSICAEVVNTTSLPAEPALPTDSTAPTANLTPSAPGISLIPTSPLLPPDARPPLPPADTSSPIDRVGALPGGLSPDPFAAPTPTPATPPAVTAPTVNDIGVVRRFQYNFGFTLGATYDNNIFLEPFGTRSDLYFTIQPTLSLGFGGGRGGGDNQTVLRFSYSPEVLLYLDHPELDAVQHFITLSASHEFAHLTLSGAADVQILDSTDVGNPHPYSPTGDATGTGGTNGDGTPIVNTPSSSVNLDVGQRTRLNLYSLALRGNYLVSEKVSYDLSGQYSFSDYTSGLVSSQTLSASGFANYSPTGKTTVGIGATAGYTLSDGVTVDQSFEQANLRLNYTPDDKFTVALQVGLELRQADGNEVTPVFELNAFYTPFDGTTVALSGSRRVATSAVVGGQNFTSTNLSLTLGQRFFQRFYLHLNVSYTNSEYTSQSGGTEPDRSENYFSLQPALDFKVHENILVGAFFSYRDNESSLTNRAFDDQQTGLRVSVSY